MAINVIILSPDSPENGKNQFLRNLKLTNNTYGINYIFLSRMCRERNIIKNINDLFHVFFSLFKMFEKVDLIHIVCLFSAPRIVADFFLIVFFHSKIVYDFRGDYVENLKKMKPLYRFFLILNTKLSRGVLCLNHANYLFLKKKNKNAQQIFNWISIQQSDSHSFEKKYDLAYHGRITQDKGFNIIRNLAMHNASWKILLIGPASNTIRKQFPPNICYIPTLTDENKIYDLLQQAKIYLFPSKREGMSFSLIEAMQLGLPVVASNISSNRYLLRMNRDCLIRSDSYLEYETKIQKLLLSEEDRLKAGNTNKEFIIANNNPDNYFRILIAYYSLLINRSKRK